MMVKICGITNRDDAMAAVESGASAIGFNFYRDSPRYIAPSGAALIAEKIPANVWKVGIFVSEGVESVAKIVLNVGLDIVQLYGSSEARGIRVWRACRANEDISAGLKNEAVEALLLDASSGDDAEYGGTGRTFEWSRAKGLPKKIIVAGGLDASNVGLAIEAAQPWGVDACSRLEKSPGLKDHEKMREFIKAALRS
jgi:phosphoribosylanthranilate isomerase